MKAIELLLFVGSVFVAMSVTIAVHEFGHFLAALMFRVPVRSIHIGLGPRLVGVHLRNVYFEIRLLPVAGGIDIANCNWIPIGRKKSPRSLNPGGRTSPALNRELLYRRKPLFARLLIIGSGPLFSILFGLAVMFCSIWLFGNIAKPVAEHPPEKHLTAASCLIDIELKKEDFAVGDLTFEMDGETITYTYPLELVPFTKGTKRGEALDYISHWWAESPQGVITVSSEGGGEIPRSIPFTMSKLLSEHQERKHLAENSSFWRQIDVSATRFSDLLNGPVTTGSEPNGTWDETFIGTQILLTKQFWETGPMAFIWFNCFLSVLAGLVNLFPLPPLDGGRMVQDLLVSLGLRGKLSRTIGEAYFIIGGIAVFLGLLAFPIVSDLVSIFS
jgi:membrane-associated protease RseP (regulator of RpoE activity)